MPSDDEGNLQRLLEIMAALRDPQSGCPWDVRQSFATIAPYTIEEAYEVADAIDRGDYSELQEELGDLLFQVAFHSRMAEEAGHFEFGDVVASICEKMVRRHPHVFAGAGASEAQIKHRWEAEKARERAAKRHNGALDGVARALPALKRAQKLQKRAARLGFDWPDRWPVLDKLREEIDELETAITADQTREQAEELGDLLFTCVNLARHLKVDAEDALRAANRKFESRFNGIEARLEARGRRFEDCTLRELDGHWEAVKRERGE